MVSPADGWDDTDFGYERGDTRISVSEVTVSHLEDGESQRFIGFTARVSHGKPGYASPKEIATYKNPKPAWELAHILTHLFSEFTTSTVMMQLEDPMEGDSVPNRGAEDRKPEQLLRDALGYNEHFLEDALP